MKPNKYTLHQDAYSLHTDKYSLHLDAYSLGLDPYSRGEDIYSIKFRNICDRIRLLLSSSPEIHYSQLNLSKKTWVNLKKRKEFTSEFISHYGKIRNKDNPFPEEEDESLP